MSKNPSLTIDQVARYAKGYIDGLRRAAEIVRECEHKLLPHEPTAVDDLIAAIESEISREG